MVYIMFYKKDDKFIRKVFHYFLHEYRNVKIAGSILLLLCFIIIIIQDNTSLEQLINKNKKPEITAESSYSNNENPKNLPRVSSLKLKTGKCSFTASWDKISEADGYQLQYAKGKKFSNKSDKKYVRKAQITIKNLKKKKKYYVRVRPYITSEGKKIYGKWCKKKKVVTK